MLGDVYRHAFECSGFIPGNGLLEYRCGVQVQFFLQINQRRSNLGIGHAAGGRQCRKFIQPLFQKWFINACLGEFLLHGVYEFAVDGLDFAVEKAMVDFMGCRQSMKLSKKICAR